MHQFEKMIRYLNNSDHDKSYSRIILFIFKNMDSIGSFTIAKLAEELYVSEATITRFCHFFEFESFKELKSIATYYVIQHRFSSLGIGKTDKDIIKNDPETFFKEYLRSVISQVEDMSENVNFSKLETVVQAIKSHKHIVLFGFSEFHSPLYHLQSGLLLSQKIVLMGETNKQQELLAKTLKEDSLAIVISSYGGYIQDNPNTIFEINKSQCETILITQSTSNLTTELFNLTIPITSRNYVKTESYAMFIVIDYIIRRYIVECLN